MPANSYTPVTPRQVYSGLAENFSENSKKLSEVVAPNNASGNNYIDLLADLIRIHGKQQAKVYAKMLGAKYHHFDGAIRCMTGLSAHNWINQYLYLIACDLVAQTHLNFKETGKLLGLSQSSFSQFFRAYGRMQPWEYRSLHKRGKKQSFFYE